MNKPTPEPVNALKIEDVLNALTKSTEEGLLNWLEIPIEENNGDYISEYAAITGSFAYKVKFKANDDWDLKIVIGNEYPIYHGYFIAKEYPLFVNAIEENYLRPETHFVGCLQDLMMYEQHVRVAKAKSGGIITPETM